MLVHPLHSNCMIHQKSDEMKWNTGYTCFLSAVYKRYRRQNLGRCDAINKNWCKLRRDYLSRRHGSTLNVLHTCYDSYSATFKVAHVRATFKVAPFKLLHFSIVTFTRSARLKEPSAHKLYSATGDAMRKGQPSRRAVNRKHGPMMRRP